MSLAIVSYSKNSHDGSSAYIGTYVVGSNKLLIPSPEHCWFGGNIMWLVDIYTELLIRVGRPPSTARRQLAYKYKYRKEQKNRSFFLI